MTIIEITANEYGGHNNQTIYGADPASFTLPEGWAVLPESVGMPGTLENFPFGEITVEEIDGVPTVTGWTPGVMPEPEPVEDPEDAEATLMETALDHELRISALELGL